MFTKASVPTLLFALLLLLACSLAPIQTVNHEPIASAEPTLIASVEAASVPKSTATSPPTPEPTATVWPPTFVFWSLQDIRQLDTSKNLTVHMTRTNTTVE
jgi:hypothetical protein